MFHVLQFAHYLTAIFVIGPLAHGATTAGRSLRHGDAHAAAYSARMTKVYAMVSVVVVIFGFGLMSSTNPRTHQVVASFSDTYIWLSTVLWMVIVVLALGVIAPALEQAAETLSAGGEVAALKARVAVSGGVIGLLVAAIVALMVFKPW